MKFKKADVCEPLFSTFSFFRPDSILFSSSNEFQERDKNQINQSGFGKEMPFFFSILSAFTTIKSTIYIDYFKHILRRLRDVIVAHIIKN